MPIAWLITGVVESGGGNEPAPTWIPIVAFAIPALIVLAVLVPALRGRRRYRKAQRAQREGVQPTTVALSSARSIGDGGSYSTEALRRALSVAEEYWGPVDDLPHNEGASGEALGLKTKINTSTELLNPNLMWGKREFGQVFIRIGPDEKVEGGTELYSNRHIRQISTLRVNAPEFVMGERDGKPAIVEGTAPDVEEVLARIQSNVGVWEGFTAIAGPEGIVCSRSVVTQPDFWIYDLWLLERIAQDAKYPPLGDAQIGPSWETPYGVGRKSIDV